MAATKRTFTNLDIASVILAVIGLVDSGYLSWIKLTHSVETCVAGLGDCATVNASQYSQIYGIPVAYLGFAAYLGVLLLILVKARFLERNSLRDYLLFALTLTGFLFSLYLTFVQFGLLRTYCPYCLLSACTTTALFILNTIRLIHAINQP